jgi:hypothetical protein
MPKASAALAPRLALKKLQREALSQRRQRPREECECAYEPRKVNSLRGRTCGVSLAAIGVQGLATCMATPLTKNSTRRA